MVMIRSARIVLPVGIAVLFIVATQKGGPVGAVLFGLAIGLAVLLLYLMGKEIRPTKGGS